ncbi:MAG: DUF4238 domain-containing protein [Bacteroidia bacterium]
MSNQETKKQHWVPKTYLEKFSIERKKDEFLIYATDKMDLKNPFSTNARDICAENYLYTLQGETEEQRQLIENIYGKSFDDNYNRFYSILTNPKINQILPSASKLIISTAVTLLFRNPKLRNSNNNLFREIFEEGFRFAEKNNRECFYLSEKKIIVRGKEINESYKSYINESKDLLNIQQLDLALKLINLRINDQIHIVKLEEQEHTLITSDHPVILYNGSNNIIAPFDIKNEIKIPIDNKHNLYIYPHSSFTRTNYITRTFHKGVVSKREMINSNQEQYNSSNKFLLGYKEDIEKYICFYKNPKNLFAKSEQKELNEIDNKFRNH